jgi:hypothetical protein
MSMIVYDSEFGEMPTTKRFARSLSEAFADERFAAIEPPPPSLRWTCNTGHRAVVLLPAIIAVIAAVFTLFTGG